MAILGRPPTAALPSYSSISNLRLEARTPQVISGPATLLLEDLTTYRKYLLGLVY